MPHLTVDLVYKPLPVLQLWCTVAICLHFTDMKTEFQRLSGLSTKCSGSRTMSCKLVCCTLNAELFLLYCFLEGFKNPCPFL